MQKFYVDYQDALWVLHNNPELSDEQVIIYFRPDCYINIFGELVDPNNVWNIIGVKKNYVTSI